MRPPPFWQRPPERPGLAARLLAPLAALYAGATASRLARGGGVRAGVPVICVGNLHAGGTGKTPAVIALARRLAGEGVHVVARGWGGRLSGPVRVAPARHGTAEVGDEALLTAAFAPVWVARDRAAGVRAAVAAGAGGIILDDGCQDPAVVHDLAIVVVDATRGFGNGRVLPAGPLREPVATGLARADLVLVLGEAPARAAFLARWPAAGLRPVAGGRLVPLATGMDWAGLRVVAFAGIGDPAKFFATLEGLGAVLHRRVALDDHQPLGEALLRRLREEARAAGAQLVCTEKDAVRLPARWRREVVTLPVRLEFEAGEALAAALARLFPGPAPGPAGEDGAGRPGRTPPRGPRAGPRTRA